MSSLKESEKQLFSNLFTGCDNSAYNLAGLTNERFRQFVYKSINIDVYSNKFEGYKSKNKKLTCLMDNFPDKTVGKLLTDLLEHMSDSNYVANNNRESYKKCMAIANRLTGNNVQAKVVNKESTTNFNFEKYLKDLGDLTKMDDTPQKRGFKFQDFLNDFFDECGFSPRKSFKTNGNQIDGSIEVDNEFYLVEAKWQNSQTEIGDLEKFETIINKQSGITRGVFISFSGFADYTIRNFRTGIASKFFLITGQELMISLENKEHFQKVFKRKLRALAEGNMFLEETIK